MLRFSSSWQHIKHEFQNDRFAKLSLLFLVVVLVTAFVSPFFIEKDQYERVDFFKIYHPPNAENLLGTDYGGRDILSLLLVGTRNSFSIAFLSSVVEGWSIEQNRFS